MHLHGGWTFSLPTLGAMWDIFALKLRLCSLSSNVSHSCEFELRKVCFLLQISIGRPTWACLRNCWASCSSASWSELFLSLLLLLLLQFGGIKQRRAPNANNDKTATPAAAAVAAAEVAKCWQHWPTTDNVEKWKNKSRHLIPPPLSLSLSLCWQPQLPLVQHPVSSTNSSSATTVSPFPCHFWALLAIVARPETRSAPQRCHIFLFSARLVFNFICARSTWNTLCSRRCQATFTTPPTLATTLLQPKANARPVRVEEGRAGQGRGACRAGKLCHMAAPGPALGPGPVKDSVRQCWLICT